ncbi:MAG: type II toxin-antitoxin system YhaV family toxin [Rhodospirillaceae bacterium]|nr:type II toxin-antitoxin system YhaV family toxin [Rhodospirillaceae bacterium]
MSDQRPLTIQGWTILAHSLFLDQLEALIAEVERARAKDPAGYRQNNVTKRLAAIAKLAFEVIPQDPERDEYRHGDTLGPEHKHWLRAKFFQQYRLFFRYRKTERIILYAWVNDTATLRAYGAKTDAYAVFKKMLARDQPPDDWAALKAESEAARTRMQSLSAQIELD